MRGVPSCSIWEKPSLALLLPLLVSRTRGVEVALLPLAERVEPLLRPWAAGALSIATSFSMLWYSSKSVGAIAIFTMF